VPLNRVPDQVDRSSGIVYTFFVSSVKFLSAWGLFAMLAQTAQYAKGKAVLGFPVLLFYQIAPRNCDSYDNSRSGRGFRLWNSTRFPDILGIAGGRLLYFLKEPLDFGNLLYRLALPLFATPFKGPRLLCDLSFFPRPFPQPNNLDPPGSTRIAALPIPRRLVTGDWPLGLTSSSLFSELLVRRQERAISHSSCLFQSW